MTDTSLETKRIKTSDGTILNYVNIGGINKLHNIDGAAILPQGNKRSAEYYLFGIRYTRDKWEEAKKNTNGVPFYKTSIGKASGARV